MHYRSRFRKAPLLLLILPTLMIAVSCSSAPGASAPGATARSAAGVPLIPLSAVADGSYRGHASMFPVDVVVQVAVAGGAITRIDLIKHFTGRGQAAEALIPRVVASQSLDVDVVSGATRSSLVILNAIADALGKGAVK